MNIRITITLKKRKPLFHKFICWESLGFDLPFFEFRIFWKIYKYNSPWQEHILNYLRTEEL